MLLTYMLMCFTKFVPDPEMQKKGGFVYIGVIASNVLIHLTFIIR